jgi:hypothetical protein
MVRDMSEPPLARKMWRTMESYHAVAYFTPCTTGYEEVGLKGRSQYFAGRSAPLGTVPVEVVIATFYNFHPDLVRSSMAGVWESTTPEAVVAARFRVADEGLRAILGDDGVTSAEVTEAAELARAAADETLPSLAGRPLFAGHAALPWPDEPHLVLWHAITLLREHRGDGHIAALVLAGLDPCEALVTHGASTDAVFPASVLQTSRAWPDAEWQAAADRLRARGWLDGDGALTAEGRAARDLVETRTDESAAAPWAAFGEERADRLRALVRPFSRAVVDSGVLFSNPL